ncbi:MAG: protein translocase subunit SecF [Acutalibacteraceae bacterium]|jgi:preprotein translocase subunit SecF
MRKQMNFDFVGKKKKFALVSLCILVVGILCNVFMGAKLDIQFTGGSIIKYSYNGDISEQAVQDALKPVTGGNESLQFNYNVYAANSDGAHNMLSVSLSEKNQLSSEDQQAMLDALKKAFPDAAVTQIESNSVEATMGQEFFWKCMVAVVLASLLMLVYVAFRFRKIGGWSAGLMALLALLNDCLVSYFVFIIFRIPLDDNFVAVILTILGYSLNDTIVVYDRIRENRRLLGPKSDLATVVNLSLNQSFGRTLNTSVATFMAVSCVTVVALIYNLDSILSFSVPMMFGVLSGFYTSVFLASPLWVGLRSTMAKRRAARAEKNPDKKKKTAAR